MKYASFFFCLAATCMFSCKTSVNTITGTSNNESLAQEDKGKDFLINAADARMMGIKEGTLAVERGTVAEIKNYGRLMIKDQHQLLGQIKKLAAKKGIMLPAEISDDKKDGLKELSEKQGKDFDKKFIKMIKIDHERDVKEFKNATALQDRNIKSFAEKNLPVIQSHLDKVIAIKKMMKD